MVRGTLRAAGWAVVFLAALLAPKALNTYWLHVTAIAWYYALMAASWALLAGYAGQFSFAHMAFAAIGGYTSGLLAVDLHLPPVLGMLCGVLAAAIVGGVIGWLCLRLRGPYLSLFTLAFAQILQLILIAEYQFTRGSLGLSVPPLFHGDSDLPYYYAGFALLLFSLGIMQLVLRSRVGIFLRATREDEDAAEASGIDTSLYKIAVFTLTSAMAGLAGGFYGHFVGILTPNIVTIPEMGLVVAMAVVGGVESLPGAVVGAVFIWVLSEVLRDYGQMRFVILGLVIMLTQRFAQNGLVLLATRLIAKRLQPQRVEESGAPAA
ncbi:MAG TPA: branched-chain amino acid ABC transporter permease [Candidatus Dormibacteraeota bacterium]|nr:branched-chain amino acid ABC transporter permease [Candidatus Dormibacteraeota bacterium]